MLNKPNWLGVFSTKLFLLIVALQHTALQSCSHIDNQQGLAQTLKSEKQMVTSKGQVNDIRVMPDENVKFEVTGTVTEISIGDISKRAGIKNLYTYITVKVERISPESVASKIKFDELSFTRRTDANIDRQISVGNQVIITVVGSDLSKQKYFRIYDMKKISL